MARQQMAVNVNFVLLSYKITVKVNIFSKHVYGIIPAYLVLTLCGLALRSTRMTRPRVQRTSP